MLSLLCLLGLMVSSVLLVDSDGKRKLTLTLSILSCWISVILLLHCSCGILIWRTIIKASINYGQRYRNVLPSLNFVPHCVASNQTASCVESSVQQPFNLSWQTFQRRNSHTSLLPLPTPGLITSVSYFTVRRTTEKRCGFLFTCLTSRAVHVEVVPSMDISSCVMGAVRLPLGYSCYALVG